jgi:hypothetical protein
MEISIITTFCICYDYLKVINFKDDSQCKMNTAEIMTVALSATKFFGGNYEKARYFFKSYGYMKMLSKSQFNRRLNAIDISIWEGLFHLIAEIFKQSNQEQKYVIDTFPVPVCHNIRISRCKIYQDEEYRGYCPSKKQYFFGLKVAMIVTSDYKPIEFIFSPGSFHDSTISKKLDFDLPENSEIYGDSAFSDQCFEDLLKDTQNINPFFDRKTNSKNPHSLWIEYMIKTYRKTIETSFSMLTNLFPKKIHAVTSFGFEL